MGVGVFGKYPLKRDFVATNLPRGVLDVLERWLQAGVAASREHHSANWKEMFLIQPIWNFRLGRQVAGLDCLGALMPSVDGVGRYFPLVILGYASSPSKILPPCEAPAVTEWLALVHERLLSAIAEGELPTPEELIAGVDVPEEVENEALAPTKYTVRPLTEDMAAVRESMRASDLQLAADLQSVWWTQGGSFVQPQIATCQGMPGPEFFSRMMKSVDSIQGQTTSVR